MTQPRAGTTVQPDETGVGIVQEGEPPVGFIGLLKARDALSYRLEEMIEKDGGWFMVDQTKFGRQCVHSRCRSANKYLEERRATWRFASKVMNEKHILIHTEVVRFQANGEVVRKRARKKVEL